MISSALVVRADQKQLAGMLQELYRTVPLVDFLYAAACAGLHVEIDPDGEGMRLVPTLSKAHGHG